MTTILTRIGLLAGFAVAGLTGLTMSLLLLAGPSLAQNFHGFGLPSSVTEANVPAGALEKPAGLSSRHSYAAPAKPVKSRSIGIE